MGGANVYATKTLDVDLPSLPTSSEYTTWTWDSKNNRGLFAWTATSYNSTELYSAGNYAAYTTVNWTAEAGTKSNFRIIVKYSNGTAQTTYNPGGDMTGTQSVSFTDMGVSAVNLACISSIRLSGTNDDTGNIYISSFSLTGPDDSREQLKSVLNSTIAIGNTKNSVAYTDASFLTLRSAITDGNTVYNNSEATEDQITTAINNINTAISGLVFKEGYSDLTKVLFRAHATFGGSDNGDGNAELVLNESTGLPYGNGSVDWLKYADLSGYDKLVVTVSAGTPRFCFNRTASGGVDDDDENKSQMIDIPGKAWGTDRYQTASDNVYTIDLAKIVSNKGYAYLHCIKERSYGTKVTVTGMYLHRPSSVTKRISSTLGYGTYCSPYALDFSGDITNLTDAYIITGYEEGTTTLQLSSVKGGTVPAGTGLLLEGSGDVTIPVVESSSTVVSSNKLVGVQSSRSVDAGIYVLLYGSDDTSGPTAFYQTTSTFTVGANTAYLPANFAGGSARSAYFFNGEITGIEKVENGELKVDSQADGKYFENGQIVIVKNGKKFNAAGAQIK